MTFRLGLAFVTLGLLTGCITLDPVADNTRYYLLSGPSESSADSPDALRIGLQPLALPAYLDRREIVIRQSGSEIVYQDGHRWADGLAATLERSLIQHLQAHEKVSEVDSAPWTDGDFDRTLTLHIEECQGNSDGQARLTASWKIDPANQRNRATFTGTYSTDDIPGLVDELGILAAQLAEAIQADLQ